MAALPSRADVIVYTSRDAFNAATTNQVLTTFDGLSNGNTFQFYGTLTQNGTSFVGTTGLNPADYLFAVNSAFIGSPPGDDAIFGPNTSFFNSAGTGQTTITLPPNTTAVGFDFLGLFLNGGGPFQVTLSTGDVFNLTSTGSFQFVGFTSTTPITDLTIRAPGVDTGFPTLDNFVTAQATVPEPASLALLGVGLVAFGGFLRCRKHPCKPPEPVSSGQRFWRSES
jgi:hypothetical protein